MVSLQLPELKIHPTILYSWELTFHHPARAGIEENSTKLGNGMGNITSAWLQLERDKFRWRRLPRILPIFP